MASEVYIYNKGIALLCGGGLDWVNDATIKCLLLTDSYTYDPTHDFVNDISAVESSGSGYNTGGVSVTGKTQTVDNTNNIVKLSCASIEFLVVSVTYRYAAIYQNTGNTATSGLIMVNKYDAPRTVTASPLTLTISSYLMAAAMPGFGF